MRPPVSNPTRNSSVANFLPTGAWIVVLSALVSSAIYFAWPLPQRPGREFWIFSNQRLGDYETAIRDWNTAHPDPRDQINITLLHYYALERRLMAAATADAPVADLVESERKIMARVFSGPLEDVGLVDLTERAKQEGVLAQLNAPSLSPWTTRGHVFGLPHDVHPCLLGYRADLVEAAGIDVSQIETWDDFRRVLGPLVRDFDGDGRPDRFLLNFSPTQQDTMEALMLQAGSRFFDDRGRVKIDTALNARIMATFASWLTGPARICADAPEFTAGGDQMRLDGTVIASVLPDWLAGTWKNFIPGLKGKVKVMRLPAWERGGLRTTVWGGTCLSITNSAPDVERSWAFAKHLYFSPAVAENLFRSTMTISPVKTLWSLPFYHEADPFFCGQKLGEFYLAEAPRVPERPASPFTAMVLDRLATVLVDLRTSADAHQQFDQAALEDEAARLLGVAQSDLIRSTERNVLFHPAP